MRLQLAQVAVIADVITDAVLLGVRDPRPGSGRLRHELDALQKAGSVRRPATQVVDLTGMRILCERPDRFHDVGAVQLVAYLLALVAVDRVLAPTKRNRDEVLEESVQLDARVLRDAALEEMKATLRRGPSPRKPGDADLGAA